MCANARRAARVRASRRRGRSLGIRPLSLLGQRAPLGAIDRRRPLPQSPHSRFLTGGPNARRCVHRRSPARTHAVPRPQPGPAEVVIEMKASGMCGSDLHQYRRPKNQERRHRPRHNPTHIAGHEPCGVVAAVGPASSRRRPASASASWCTTIRAAPSAAIAAPAGSSSVRRCR